MNFKTIILALLFVLLFTPSIKGQIENITVLEDSIEAIMLEKNIPGLFISVVSKDSIKWKKCFGYSNVEKQEKVNPEHFFRMGSITKTFTALAILKLVKDGKLHLDDELKNIAPGIKFQNDWEASHPVLLKHVLGHQAGFDDMHLNTFMTNRTDHMTALEEVEVYQKSLVSRWKPGLVKSYSNPGYVILGYIIEKTTGIPYQQYIKEEVLAPLNMNKTHFISQRTNNDPLDYALGYKFENDEIMLDKEMNPIGETTGSILSNANDMSLFLQYFLDETKQDVLPLIGKNGVTEMEQLHGWFEKENNIRNGYGFGIYDRAAGSEKLLFKGHNGGMWGFVSDYIYNKEYDFGLIISNNKMASNRAIMDLIVDYFLKNKKTPIPKTNSLSKEIPSDWDGLYTVVNHRNELFRFINYPFQTLKIKAKGDSIHANLFLGKTEFYSRYQENAFLTSEEKNPSLYLTSQDGQKSIYYDQDLLVRVNSSKMLALRIFIGTAIFSALSLLLLLIVQLIGSIFKKNWRSSILHTMTFLSPYILFFASIFFLIAYSSIDKVSMLGQLSFPSISIFILTALMPLAALASLFYLIKKRRLMGSQILKTCYAISTVAGIFLISYCVKYGWFAMQLWNY